MKGHPCDEAIGMPLALPYTDEDRAQGRLSQRAELPSMSSFQNRCVAW